MNQYTSKDRLLKGQEAKAMNLFELLSFESVCRDSLLSLFILLDFL